MAGVPRNFKKAPTGVTGAIKYGDEGRYFYDVHRVLKAVTRPAEHHGYLQDVVINTRIAVNFVVFVDDLDRCLPEKSVAVLELIKTVFNVESFAFVLALDDEVIERGIAGTVFALVCFGLAGILVILVRRLWKSTLSVNGQQAHAKTHQ